MSRRRTPRTNVITLTTGRGVRTAHLPYPKRSPVLVLDFGAMSVRVGASADGRVSPEDLTFARQLADQAAAFARELTLRHAYENTEN
jgi:hypothetical protein